MYGGPTAWRVLKYDQGFFYEHIDYQYHPRHIGNEILLPPTNQNKYEGGALVLLSNGERVAITPKEDQWTYVFIPLGMIHSVENVKGTRYSFVRRVFGKYKFDYQKTE